MGRRFDPDRAHVVKSCEIKGGMRSSMTSDFWVDLDGTLIKQDSTLMCLYQYWTQKGTLCVLSLLMEHRFNRFKIKSQISKELDLDEIKWDFDLKLVQLLEESSGKGCRIYLVTASSEEVANYFLSRFAFFSAAFFSTGSKSMKGLAKYELMREKSRHNFFYFGDAIIDLRVWRKIGHANISRKNIKLRILIRLQTKKVTVSLF